MADKTENAANAPTGSDASRIQDAIRGAGGVNDDEQEELDGGDDNAAEDDHSNADDGNGNGDDNQDDGADGGSDEDAGDDNEEGDSGEVKLSQFKGDGKRGSYTKNLEKGYVDLAQQNNENSERADAAERQVTAIREAARKDPEFGQKLLQLLDVDGSGNSGEGAQGSDSNAGASNNRNDDDPFLVNARTEWRTKNEESTKEFVDANPEVITDPKLNKEVKRLMKRFSDAELADNGRLMQGGEAMAKAYAYLGLTDKRKNDQALRDGMKGGAAPTRPQRPTKKAAKSGAKQFSDLTLSMAAGMGISKERLAKGTSKS